MGLDGSTSGRAAVRLLGVPFNSDGTRAGVAAAPAALREAGLADVPGLRDAGDVAWSGDSTIRSASGLLNEDGLVAMVDAVAADLGPRDEGDDAAGLPLLVGGDCPVLLGALLWGRRRLGAVGLLMVDGHEDGYPPLQSSSGEAADSELHLALGLPVPGLPPALARHLPLLAAEDVVLLGPRDAGALAAEGVRSLRGTVTLHDDAELRDGGPADVASREAARLAAGTPGWWLHTDLDVLSTAALPAVDYPQPGGLDWDQLTAVARAALEHPGCLGWSVTIYNPELDEPGRPGAERVVRFVRDVLVG